MELYNIYFEDDTILCPSYKDLTEQQLRENILSCYYDMEDDGCFDDMEPVEIKDLFNEDKPIKEVIEEYEEMLGNKIKTNWEVSEYLEQNERTTRILENAICNAIKFNTVWKAQDHRELGKSYYDYNIKPLYYDVETKLLRFSVVAHLMCPSGISDNGIRKHIERDICIVGEQFLSDLVAKCCKMLEPRIKIDCDYTIV